MKNEMFVRLMPRKLGGKVQRVTIGATTFQAERWYKLDADHANKLSSIPQSRFTATKMFQVVSAQEYTELSRQELATAMLGSAGADALAVLNGIQGAPALGKSKKSKAKKSDFASIKVDEVDPAHSLRKAVVEDADEDEDADDDVDGDEDDDSGEGDDGEGDDATKVGQADIDGLTRKAQALELAEKYSLTLDPKLSLAEMKKTLATEIYGDGT